METVKLVLSGYTQGAVDLLGDVFWKENLRQTGPQWAATVQRVLDVMDTVEHVSRQHPRIRVADGETADGVKLQRIGVDECSCAWTAARQSLGLEAIAKTLPGWSEPVTIEVPVDAKMRARLDRLRDFFGARTNAAPGSDQATIFKALWCVWRLAGSCATTGNSLTLLGDKNAEGVRTKTRIDFAASAEDVDKARVIAAREKAARRPAPAKTTGQMTVWHRTRSMIANL